jgi:hypothetical protein
MDRTASGIHRKKWTREMVVQQILELHAERQPLCCSAVWKRFPALVSAAGRLYGRWNSALKSAGINPGDHAKRWTMHPQECKDLIRQLHLKGEALNYECVKRRQPVLHWSSIKHWGSWDKALHCAGLAPEKIRRKRKPWSPTEIIEWIQNHHRQGLALNAYAIPCSTIMRSGRFFFGNWDAALTAAGLDPQRIRRRRVWDEKRVIQVILSRAETGSALYSNAVRREDSPCYNAALRRFGSWSKALRAAGIDPNAIRRWRHPWTRETIVAELKRRHLAGLSTSPRTIRPVSLVGGAYRVFGTWSMALSEAGIPRRRAVPWTRSSVLEVLCSGLRSGEPIYRWRPPSLYGAARRLFGTWNAALRAARVRLHVLNLKTPSEAHR